MSVDQAIRARGISEMLHFTTNRGLVGILAGGALLSRFRLPSEKYLEHLWRANAASRPEEALSFDKSQNWLDYVNLSISEINSRFFLVSTRWHRESDMWWVLLSFDAAIAGHDGVHFTTTNNGYDQCVRGTGTLGMDRLFAPVVLRKSQGNWRVSRGQRESHLPTCEQAEVLYPGGIELTWLRKIYVREPDQRDVVLGWLREFEWRHIAVEINPNKFNGQPN